MSAPPSNFLRLSRYALIGAGSNAGMYAGFVLLCRAGMDAKASMTCTYAAGIAFTFVFNRRWTFRDYHAYRGSFLRYCVVYAAGYLVNLAALWFLVDRLGWSHDAVQAALILLVAAGLFLAQKHWVFRAARPA